MSLHQGPLRPSSGPPLLVESSLRILGTVRPVIGGYRVSAAALLVGEGKGAHYFTSPISTSCRLLVFGGFFCHLWPLYLLPAMDMSTTARATGKELTAEAKQVPSKYEIDGIEEAGDGSKYVDGIEGHTKNDHRNMARMGKRQELMRNFRPLSALSFTVLLQATWEYLLM